MALTKVSNELIKDNSITMDKMHTGVVIKTSDGLHNNANDTVLPTAGAVVSYVTSQVTGANNWDLSFAWGDHSTYGYATETYVNNSIANVINSAPAALDTLNELAAALGDDPNFATTVTNLIAGKQAAGTYNTIIGTDTDINTSGATIVDNIYVTDGVITSMGTRTLTLGDLGYTGATNANYITNNNQLTNGAGYLTTSGKAADANLLDGLNSTQFLRSDANDTYTGILTFGSLESKIYGADNYPLIQVNSNRAYFGSTSRAKSVIASSDAIKHVRAGTEYDIWTAYNDGSGSGLDADLLDGLQGSQFLRSDANDTTSGNLTISKSYPKLSLYDTTNLTTTRPSIEWETTANQGVAMSMSVFDSELPEAGYGLIVGPSSTNAQWPATGNLSFSVLGEIYAGSESLGSVNKVWHAGNDGSGSGLDADLLDGQHASAFSTTSHLHDDRYLRKNYANGSINVNSSVGTQLFVGSTGGWSNRGPSSNNAGAFLSLNTHPGNYYSQLWFNTAGNALYHRAANNQIPSSSWDRILTQNNASAPIFYDSNNTGYYLNPASTSNLNALTTQGQSDFRSKRHNFGLSSGWDAIGFGNATNLHMNGHNQFWIGAGNGTWFTGTANSKSQVSGLAADAGYAHDLLLSTMQSTSTASRGITFGVDNSGSGTSGWRLGKWHSGDAKDSSKLVVDGGLFVKGGYTDEYDYYADDYSTYYSTQGGGAFWNGGTNNPSATFSTAIQIQSGNKGSNTRNPQIQFHQYGYGGVQFRYDGPNDRMFLEPMGSNRLDWTRLQTDSGYIDFGPANSGHAHIYTDRANFYFNKQLTVSGGSQINSGDIRSAIFYDSNNTAYYLNPSGTGDSIRVAGDIVAYYSDERLKDIKGNIENAVDKVKQLNGFYYSANETAQKLGYKVKDEVGVSAQEVEKVLPEIIKEAPIGQGYKTLDYSKIVPLLIEAIKEQQTQIDELKQLINKQ